MFVGADWWLISATADGVCMRTICYCGYCGEFVACLRLHVHDSVDYLHMENVCSCAQIVFVTVCAGVFDGNPETMLAAYWSILQDDVVAEQRAILAAARVAVTAERAAATWDMMRAAEEKRAAAEVAAAQALEAEFAGCLPVAIDLDCMVLPPPCGLHFGQQRKQHVHLLAGWPPIQGSYVTTISWLA